MHHRPEATHGKIALQLNTAGQKMSKPRYHFSAHQVGGGGGTSVGGGGA